MKERHVPSFHILILLAALCFPCQIFTRETVIFSDDFETEASWYTEKTANATRQEYSTAQPDGHLLKKWKYLWDYDPEGVWTQAFYCIRSLTAASKFMSQDGRSACGSRDNYVILADAEIPASAVQYKINYAFYKWDNDPVYNIVSSDLKGRGCIFGYENQLPGTDTTVPDAYTIGQLGSKKIKNASADRRWVDVEITVNVLEQHVKWTVDGIVFGDTVSTKVVPGGYYGIKMCYERGTRFDDFVITILKSADTDAADMRNVESPETFGLKPNYPNPFNPVTTLRFNLTKANPTELIIFDITGKRIRSLIHSYLPAGSHQIRWDGKDTAGNAMPSGIYISRLSSGSLTETRPLILTK